ncbi:hypothetical protein HZA44_03345 [Candidatus Peregrinibacteria bacterium]|nr:hypothetical protein [Candidatus Peregrinibacteria bacterium]
MNLKKCFATIVLLALVVGFVQPFGWALAEDAPTPPPTPRLIKECEEFLPKYPEDKKISIDQPYAGKYELNFRIGFEKARTAYHTYVECVFEKVVDEVMGSAGGTTKGIFSAHAPNLPELLKPESACIAEKDLSDKLKDGSPAVLLDPLLQEYNRYVDYVEKLYSKTKDKVTITQSSSAFEEALSNSQSMKLLVENEIQDSLVALDGAFIGIKEMRQAFIMHIHFQCMLKNLEFYRHALENLRRVIYGLPDNIINASTHK